MTIDTSTATGASLASAFKSILFREPDDATFNELLKSVNAGTLTLAQVKLSFVNSAEAQSFVDPVFRLYQAAFGRVPDDAGIKFWVNNFRNGTTTLDKIADGFSASGEFTKLYGDVTNRDALVKALYLNVLGRAPDAEGAKFWLDPAKSVKSLLLGFAQSGEFIIKAQPPINAYLIGGTDSLPTGQTGLFPPGDSTPPTLKVAFDKTSIPTSGTSTVTLTFSEAVKGFDLTDLKVVGGKLSNLLVSPTDPKMYVATFTADASPGPASISLTGDYTDLAGNAGTFTDTSSQAGSSGAATVFAVSSGGGGGTVTPPTPTPVNNFAPVIDDLVVNPALAATEVNGATRIAKDADLFTIKASDKDGGALTYSVQPSNVSQFFNIDGTGKVTLNADYDYGNAQEIFMQIGVNDGQNTAIKDILVRLGLEDVAGDTIDGSGLRTQQYIFGFGGNDLLKGGSGNDVIFGGTGEDTIEGGDGNDTIVGGANGDILSGGESADTFVYKDVSDSHVTSGPNGAITTTVDLILDFKAGEDKIDLKAINATLTNKLTFKGEAKTAVAEKNGVSYFYDQQNDRTYIGVDTDGNASADPTSAEMVIALQGKVELKETDFILT